MTQPLTIGIDLGGTHCRAGVVNAEGKVIVSFQRTVGTQRSPEAVVHWLSTLVDELQGMLVTSHQSPATAVGIGVPGIVEFTEGLVYTAPHFPEWDRVPLAAILRQRLGCPVAVDNDAHVVALGELWQGAARDLRHCCVLTFGTGIGGALVIDRQVFRGDAGFAGEVGHFVIQFDGPQCACGSAGCWEMYASATGMRHLIASSNLTSEHGARQRAGPPSAEAYHEGGARRALPGGWSATTESGDPPKVGGRGSTRRREPEGTRAPAIDPGKVAFIKLFDGNLDRVEPVRVFALAREGNIFARTLWEKFGAYCGAGIASLVNITGLHHVVIGGGLSGAWEYFIGETERSIGRRTYRATADRIRLHRATLGHAAGIIGAARLMQCASA